MSRLLICKDKEQNKLLEVRPLIETDNITYSIISNAPVIEEREGQVGNYALDESGQVIVVYEAKPKTEIELLQEKVSRLEESIAIIQSKH